MIRVTIDGRSLTSPAALHDVLKSELHFPDYYGRNLSALHDVLTDIREPLCIAIESSVEAKNALDEYWWRFIEVVLDSGIRLLLI